MRTPTRRALFLEILLICSSKRRLLSSVKFEVRLTSPQLLVHGAKQESKATLTNVEEKIVNYRWHKRLELKKGKQKHNALHLSVNVFSGNVLIEDTIFRSKDNHLHD